MSSFSCPHYDFEKDRCTRLDTDCVPGRAGCVLRGRATFIVPAEERVREREEAKRRAPGFTESPPKPSPTRGD